MSNCVRAIACLDFLAFFYWNLSVHTLPARVGWESEHNIKVWICTYSNEIIMISWDSCLYWRWEERSEFKMNATRHTQPVETRTLMINFKLVIIRNDLMYMVKCWSMKVAKRGRSVCSNVRTSTKTTKCKWIQRSVTWNYNKEVDTWRNKLDFQYNPSFFIWVFLRENSL